MLSIAIDFRMCFMETPFAQSIKVGDASLIYWKRMVLRASLVAVLAVAAAAQQWIPAPEGGVSMFPADSIAALRRPGGASESEIVDVQGMTFTRAMKVTLTAPPRNAWDVQILGTTTGEVQQGDVLWLSVFARGSSQTWAKA